MKPPYISAADFAKRHDVEPQTVRLWIKEGAINGAVLIAGRWLIPQDAERPIDGRTTRFKKPG